MRSLKIIIVIFTLQILVGCCVFRPKPELIKRYKKIDQIEVTGKANYYVEITGFVTKPKNSASKSVFDLSDRGQKALVEALSKSEKDPSKLISNLAKSIKVNKAKKLITDKSIFKKRIVLSIADITKFRKADRLQYIKIQLKRPNSNNYYELLSWDKIVTNYQTYDFGKLTFSQTDSFSLGTELALSGTVKGSASGSFSNTDALNEEIQLSKKIPILTGSITNKEMVIHRQSVALESMEGNIIIEVTFKLNSHPEKSVYNFNGLYDSSGKENTDDANIMVSQNFYLLPSVTDVNNTSMDLSYEIEYRKVIKGDDTEVESDDEINLIHTNSHQNSFFNLCDEEDLNINLWVLKNSNTPIVIKQGGNIETLRFDSYQKALKFLKWLKMTKKTQFSGYEILGPLGKLTNTQIDNLFIGLN